MPQEIEAKFKVDDAAGLRRRLSGAGAVCLGTVTLRDDYLDTADERLKHARSGLRVRVGRTASLTYKGPRQEDARFKTREELEVTVDDPQALLHLLTRIGFHVIFSYQKRRETWRLGACEVSLDELPQLGWFVEVEAPDEQAVAAALERLGLASRRQILDSYLHLIHEHVERTDPGATTLYFQ